MIVGLALNFAALLLLVDAYVGIFRRHPRQIGVDPEWLASKANDAEWRADRHLASASAFYVEAFMANRRAMASSARSQAAGLGTLVGAVLAYAGVAVYVL